MLRSWEGELGKGGFEENGASVNINMLSKTLPHTDTCSPEVMFTMLVLLGLRIDINRLPALLTRRHGEISDSMSRA